MYVASDPHALTPYTRRVIFMNDGEIAELTSTFNIYKTDGQSSDGQIEVLEEEWATGRW